MFFPFYFVFFFFFQAEDGIRDYKVTGVQTCALPICFITHDDAVVLHIQLDDVNRLGRGDAQTFALADGVKLDAVVMAKHLVVEIHNLAAMLLHQVRLLKKAAVVVVGHEADFHALFLVGGLEIAVPRHFARVAFGLFAKWKYRARKLILSQGKQEVTLVFTQIAAPLEEMAARSAEHRVGLLLRAFGTGRGGARRSNRPLHPREMSGGDKLRAELIRAVNEPAE